MKRCAPRWCGVATSRTAPGSGHRHGPVDRRRGRCRDVGDDPSAGHAFRPGLVHHLLDALIGFRRRGDRGGRSQLARSCCGTRRPHACSATSASAGVGVNRSLSIADLDPAWTTTCSSGPCGCQHLTLDAYRRLGHDGTVVTSDTRCLAAARQLRRGHRRGLVPARRQRGAPRGGGPQGDGARIEHPDGRGRRGRSHPGRQSRLWRRSSAIPPPNSSANPSRSWSPSALRAIHTGHRRGS